MLNRVFLLCVFTMLATGVIGAAAAAPLRPWIKEEQASVSLLLHKVQRGMRSAPVYRPIPRNPPAQFNRNQAMAGLGVQQRVRGFVQQGRTVPGYYRNRVLAQNLRALPSPALRSNALSGVVPNSAILQTRAPTGIARSGTVAYASMRVPAATPGSATDGPAIGCTVPGRKFASFEGPELFAAGGQERWPLGTYQVASLDLNSVWDTYPDLPSFDYQIADKGCGPSGMLESFNSVAWVSGKSVNPYFNSASFGPHAYRALLVAKNSRFGSPVVGKFPIYISVSESSRAGRFQIPIPIWKKMSPDQQWTANQKWLDRNIRREKIFILASDPRESANMTGWYGREIEYLKSNGYAISDSGREMRKSK